MRRGKLTRQQQIDLEQLYPRYGLSREQPIDSMQAWAQAHPNTEKLLEIGFGMGDSLCAFCRKSPQVQCLGIEVYPPGISHCLNQIKAQYISNLMILQQDAIEVLEAGLSYAQLDYICVLFPDPWPKKRHQKRRFLNETSLRTLVEKLKPAGKLMIRTDAGAYALKVQQVIHGIRDLEEIREPALDPLYQVYGPTKYEQKSLAAGSPIHHLLYRRRAIL